jgi:outer membrane protein OmpA-like peptidoglycan-associated protein
MPPTTVIGGDGAGGTAYYQTYQPSQPSAQPSTLRPASYASDAVTVDMSAVDRGGGAPSFYPSAMSDAYAPVPTMTQPAMAYSPGSGGGPAGMIYFGEGGAKLDGSDREVLKSVAAIYRQRGGVIRVVGHSSRDGAADDAGQQANLKLSWARANAVARELARDGIDPGAIQADALGDSQPIYLETTAAGRAANRRVEIYFY